MRPANSDRCAERATRLCFASLCFQSFLMVKCFKKATERKFPQDGNKRGRAAVTGSRGAPEGAPPQVTALTAAAPLLPVGFLPPPPPFPWRQVSPSVCKLLQVRELRPLRTHPRYPFWFPHAGPV